MCPFKSKLPLSNKKLENLNDQSKIILDFQGKLFRRKKEIERTVKFKSLEIKEINLIKSMVMSKLYEI